MDERIRALEEMQRNSLGAHRSTLAVLDGLQKQIESVGRITGHVLAMLSLMIAGDERPAVKEHSQKALAEIAELEHLARLGGDDAPGGEGGVA
jgi:hypothetical protein